MKRIFLLILVVLLVGGCSYMRDLRARILQRGSDTANAISEQYKKTRDSVTKKVRDVKDAAKEVKEAASEVNEAVDAVRKIGGEKNQSGTSTESAGAGTSSPSENTPKQSPNLKGTQ